MTMKEAAFQGTLTGSVTSLKKCDWVAGYARDWDKTSSDSTDPNSIGILINEFSTRKGSACFQPTLVSQMEQTSLPGEHPLVIPGLAGSVAVGMSGSLGNLIDIVFVVGSDVVLVGGQGPSVPLAVVEKLAVEQKQMLDS